MTPTRLLAGLVIIAASVVVVGCGGDDSGAPDPVTDGSFAAYAIAGEGAVPDASLEITGDGITISSGQGTVEAGLSDGDESYLLCPPSGRGEPGIVDGPLVIGDETFARPAVFGNCGVTSPRRVTLVDLDSFDEGQTLFPFSRWVEFCDVSDPDC